MNKSTDSFVLEPFVVSFVQHVLFVHLQQSHQCQKGEQSKQQ